MVRHTQCTYIAIHYPGFDSGVTDVNKGNVAGKDLQENHSIGEDITGEVYRVAHQDLGGEGRGGGRGRGNHIQTL